jgi:hypothetical protein
VEKEGDCVSNLDAWPGGADEGAQAERAGGSEESGRVVLSEQNPSRDLQFMRQVQTICRTPKARRDDGDVQRLSLGEMQCIQSGFADMEDARQLL